VAGASSAKDLKLALQQVEKAIAKSQAGQTVKASIRKLANNFNNLVESKKGTTKKSTAKKIVKTGKSVKDYIKSELQKLYKYAKRLSDSKKQVESSLSKLKGQSSIDKKSQKKK